MRLVFVLYAEDRDLLPSRIRRAGARDLRDGYSVRGLYAKLAEDATLNPDTMDERRGGWGGLLALFRLIHHGHKTGFVQARGGKLFDPDEFPFLEGPRLEGRAGPDSAGLGRLRPAHPRRADDPEAARRATANVCPTGRSMSSRSARSTRP